MELADDNGRLLCKTSQPIDEQESGGANRGAAAVVVAAGLLKPPPSAPRRVRMPDAVADLEILERIRSGDPAALASALDRFWTPLVRYAASVLGEDGAAEDVAQECFVRLWERRETWGLEGSVRGLLFRMARNLALDERRRTGARDRAAEGAPARRSAPLPDELAEDAECRALLAAAVEALPDRRREVFVLVRFHGLSHREVAQALDLSPQTVANHLHLALTDLRAALAPRLGRAADW